MTDKLTEPELAKLRWMARDDTRPDEGSWGDLFLRLLQEHTELAHSAELLRQETEILLVGIARIRDTWPHIELPGPGTPAGPVKDPGSPTCLRCTIEALLEP